MSLANWQNVKTLLCIRPDNMGDLIMSGPALRALKETFKCRITVLTSGTGSLISPNMPEIDETIVFDAPWVNSSSKNNTKSYKGLINLIKQKKFDAAVIFTVFSQSPLPSAMMAWYAGIPRVLSYCRENPYGLITDWVPDREPFEHILHQVERDLNLVKHTGATTNNDRLKLSINRDLWASISARLINAGADTGKPWIILHAGVSEIKRRFPTDIWIAVAKLLIRDGFQIVLTGSQEEADFITNLSGQIGEGSFSVAGMFSVEDMITLIAHAKLLLTVNTGVVHIAAATQTPVVVLYAQTNPQHTPWKVQSRVIEFPVAEELKSENELLKYIDTKLYSPPARTPTATEIVNAVMQLVNFPVALPSLLVPNQNPATPTS